MSVETAREAILAKSSREEPITDGMLDRLILEVQAGMRCARTWEPRHSHGAWNCAIAEDRSCLGKPRFCTECGAKIDMCPSCTARMKLTEVTVDTQGVGGPGDAFPLRGTDPTSSHGWR